jgi:aspartyl-tRNA(Asn)/glutamyl-tRNA(Gln) amidotransferase subunit A
MDDLCFMPARDAAALIREKKLSPVELMSAVIARIEALEPKVNAFAVLAADAAMAGAKRAEAALTQSDGDLGPLHGIPVTIKDLAAVEDMPFERGSHIEAGHVAAADAPFVTRLRTAGAIVLGKTTTSEFGWKGECRRQLRRSGRGGSGRLRPLASGL